MPVWLVFSQTASYRACCQCFPLGNSLENMSMKYLAKMLLEMNSFLDTVPVLFIGQKKQS